MKLAKGGGPGSRFAGLAGILGSLFILAFFTVHFGGFHLAHSVFLFLFFPIGAWISCGKAVFLAWPTTSPS